MKILRKSSEEEMILEFLKAEYTSERFSERLKNAIAQLDCEESIILAPNLQNEKENNIRKQILGAFRGYGENRELFERFPKVLDWSLCTFSGDDLKKIRYIDYCYWNELSSGTRMPLRAVDTIRKGILIYGVPHDRFLRAAEYIKEGGAFPKLFFLTSDYESFVIVEGHLRMTAYALEPDGFENIEVIVGKCDRQELIKWM